MAALIECVPNFSEGRRPEVIEAIVEPFRGRPGVSLLDFRADVDHNRLVVSLVGRPEPIQEALVEASRQAIGLIDLNHHQGGHPRIGAVDVIPFIPLQSITLEECADLARDFGQIFNQALGVPVYFYEAAARRSDRTRLEVIRRGQFETLKLEITDPERHPDVGPPQIHPTAGATVIGARKFLIAYNVNLATTDVKVAREIARVIRSSGGGLGQVKAIGLELPEKGLVQVSMNIVDFEQNPLYRVVEFIRTEARRWGVTIAETEVYGLTPAAALLQSAAYYLQLNDFDPTQVIELGLLDMMNSEE